MKTPFWILSLIFFVGTVFAWPFFSHLSSTDIEWNKFKLNYAKTYSSSQEEQERKLIFKRNLDEIEAHNKEYNMGLKPFEIGVNEYSDMPPEEFASIYTGGNMLDVSLFASNISQLQEEDRVGKSVSATPSTWDWRTASPSILNNVKSEYSSCPASWAYAAVATLESAYNLKYRSEKVSFSEQFFIDCTYSGTGCSSGYVNEALALATKRKIALSSEYAYKGSAGTCKNIGSVRKAKEYATFENATVKDIKDLVYKYGAVAITMDASETTFKTYRSGIYVSCITNATSIGAGGDFAVNIVGFNKDNTYGDYFIIRTNLGKSWGERGYFRIQTSSPILFLDDNWVAIY